MYRTALEVIFWLSFPFPGLLFLDQSPHFFLLFFARDFVFALPENGHEVVHDGVLPTGRLQLQQDPLLLAAGVFGLVDVVPAIRPT